MKIRPDDPWYPSDDPAIGEGGVTIRLHLAETAMGAIVTGSRARGDKPSTSAIRVDAFGIADAMIERANREEGESE